VKIHFIVDLIGFTFRTQLNTYVLLLKMLDRFKRSWLATATGIWSSLQADIILQGEVSGWHTILKDLQHYVYNWHFVCILTLWSLLQWKNVKETILAYATSFNWGFLQSKWKIIYCYDFPNAVTDIEGYTESPFQNFIKIVLVDIHSSIALLTLYQIK